MNTSTARLVLVPNRSYKPAIVLGIFHFQHLSDKPKDGRKQSGLKWDNCCVLATLDEDVDGNRGVANPFRYRVSARCDLFIFSFSFTFQMRLSDCVKWVIITRSREGPADWAKWCDWVNQVLMMGGRVWSQQLTILCWPSADFRQWTSH